MLTKSNGLLSRLGNHIRHIPTPIGGLALGIASLGAGWHSIIPEGGLYIRLICAAISTLLMLMLIAKFIVNPKMLWEDLRHPVVGSVLPTAAMATMLISSSINFYLPQLASPLWLTAVICHIVFFTIFLLNHLPKFRLHHMVPSWFVPPIGIIVSALSCPDPQYLPLVHGLFYFGLVFYGVQLPLMMYRLIFSHAVADAAKPTIAIMAAPASLSLAGYLSAFEQHNVLLVFALAGIAIMMTMLVYLALFHLLQLPFSPGYAAFTFPLAVGAAAQIKLANWLVAHNIESSMAPYIYGLGLIELGIATVVISYVAYRYSGHLVREFVTPVFARPALGN